MKKIKSNNRSVQKVAMKNSTKIILYSIAGIVLLAIIVLMVIEGSAGQITVRNDSDIKLEYVKTYFIDSEEMISDEEMLFEDIESSVSLKLPLEKIDLSYRQANLEVRFKLEGHDEMFVDAGYFNEIFDGKINISFQNIMNENKLLLKIKASAGVLPSPHMICNEEHVINLDEDYVEE